MQSDLSGSQKTRWNRLKGEILKRPFLAFTIGLSKQEVEKLFSGGFPTQERLEEIYVLLMNERDKKIERLRNTLTKVVGHRGSAQFAEKVGTDGMTIKYIIDRKNRKPPNFDLIARIEIYLSYVSDFEVSLENQYEADNYLENTVDHLQVQALKIAESIRELNLYFATLKKFDKKSKSQSILGKSETWQLGHLQHSIKSAIDELREIENEVDIIINDLLDVER